MFLRDRKRALWPGPFRSSIKAPVSLSLAPRQEMEVLGPEERLDRAEKAQQEERAEPLPEPDSAQVEGEAACFRPARSPSYLG